MKKFSSYLLSLFSKILDFIFPPSCLICKVPVSEHGTMCGECWAKFTWISAPKCVVCGYPFPADLDLGLGAKCPTCAANKNEMDWIRSACTYDDVSANIMLPFKHAAQLKYRKIMARSLKPLLRELPDAVDVVLPMPISYLRLWRRGYNQAALLAAPLAKELKVPMNTKAIWRKYRKSMANLTAAQRVANVKGVFKVRDKSAFRGKVVLVIDDVMTHGASFAELYRVLKRAGAKSVYGITFCRVVRDI